MRHDPLWVCLTCQLAATCGWRSNDNLSFQTSAFMQMCQTLLSTLCTGLQYIPKARVCLGRYPTPYHTDWMVKNVLWIHFLGFETREFEPNFKFWHLRPTQFFVIVLLLNWKFWATVLKQLGRDTSFSFDQKCSLLCPSYYTYRTVVFEKLKVLIELTVLAVTLPCVRLKLLDDNDTV